MTWLWCYLSFNAGLLVGIVWQVIEAERQDKLQAAFFREFESSRPQSHQLGPASSAHE
jgi:hypothetical protein